MPPKKSQSTTEQFPDLHELIENAVKTALELKLDPIRKQLDQIENSITNLNKVVQRVAELETEVEDVKNSVQNCTDSVEILEKTTLPAITEHFARVGEHLAHHTLKLDAHRRKWNVIIHGIEGDVGEDESATRKKTTDFAQHFLGLDQKVAEGTSMSACHRLSHKKDAGVIVRFVDLSVRDKWLAGTRKLKDTARGRKISLSTDLPPVIRPMKDELMLKRSKMSADLKLKTKLKYLPQWPFVELRTEGKDPTRPTKSLREVTSEVLGHYDHVYQFT